MKIDKKGALASDKVVTIILVVLVIVGVIMLLMKADILAHLRNLPGNSYDKEDKVVTVDPDKLAASGARLVQVGKIGEDANRWWSCGGILSRWDVRRFYFIEKGQASEIPGIYLFTTGEGSNKQIVLEICSGQNTRIATWDSNSGKLIVDPNSYYLLANDKDKLNLIDGSYYKESNLEFVKIEMKNG